MFRSVDAIQDDTLAAASARSTDIAGGIGEVARYSAQTTDAATSTQAAAEKLARTAAELHVIVGAFRA